MARRTWRVRGLDGPALLAALERRGLPAAASGQDGAEIELASDLEAAELLEALVRDGVRVVALHPAAGVLEQTYLTLTEDRR